MLGRPEGVSPVPHTRHARALSHSTSSGRRLSKHASYALRQAQGTSEELRNWLLRGIYRSGWRLAARLPARLIAVMISVISWVALRQNGRHVRTLRSNLMQTTGAPVGEELLRAALASYLRAFYEVLALPDWSETEIRTRVTAVNEAAVRDAHAGPGAVVALPHSGNWDLAGAWACVTGMPVTTVAEQLPDREFADFVAFREGLGLQVLSHRDPGVLAALVEAIQRRRVVCLLADRDLTGTGVPVAWRGSANHHAGRTCDSRPAYRSDPTACGLPVHRARHGDHHRRSGHAPSGTRWLGGHDAGSGRLLCRNHRPAAGGLAHDATVFR